MTWLSEINPFRFERKGFAFKQCVFCFASEGDPHAPSCDFERMARVIREIVEAYNYLKRYADVIHRGNAEKYAEVLDNLSPDAKEVINDSAATRSS